MAEITIKVRWRDMDAYGHVNNAVYLNYLEECRDRMVETLSLLDEAPVVSDKEPLAPAAAVPVAMETEPLFPAAAPSASSAPPASPSTIPRKNPSRLSSIDGSRGSGISDARRPSRPSRLRRSACRPSRS